MIRWLKCTCWGKISICLPRNKINDRFIRRLFMTSFVLRQQSHGRQLWFREWLHCRAGDFPDYIWWLCSIVWTVLLSSYTYFLCACCSSFFVCKYKAWYRCDGGAKFCRWHYPEVSRKSYDCVHDYLAQKNTFVFFVDVSDRVYLIHLTVIILYATIWLI